MSAEFGKQLQDAIDNGTIKANLAGIALGDSWISPMDFVNTWPEYLYSLSFLDGKQLIEANAKAEECQGIVDAEQWHDASECFHEMENLISQQTAGVNLMNGKIRQKFGSTIPKRIQFGAQSWKVFKKQQGDFMTANYGTVDNLLSRGINVSIFNGQLDLICNTLGVEKWLQRLQWKHRDDFLNSDKTDFGEKQVWGFQKGFKNLQLFYILRAGHMVAYDVPWPALGVVKKIIGKSS
uniref:Serine carboxypeptidase n=1 Tax=Panagrolaimus superbus TaxID=310955 RepID=A0A914Z0G0_9BILA